MITNLTVSFSSFSKHLIKLKVLQKATMEREVSDHGLIPSLYGDGVMNGKGHQSENIKLLLGDRFDYDTTVSRFLSTTGKTEIKGADSEWKSNRHLRPEEHSPSAFALLCGHRFGHLPTGYLQATRWACSFLCPSLVSPDLWST